MNETSLYVHIPFCIKKCGYCDFFSIESPGVYENYVNALCREIEWYAKTYALRFNTVYIGGGTPGLMSALQIKTLFNTINRYSSSLETTFEMNPESVSEEKLLALKDCGVTRLSLGIQSLNQKALDSSSRHCTAECCKTALKTVQKLWHGNVSLDVIAGLPNQDDGSFMDSLKRVTDYGFSHVSLYSLTLEEGTPLYERFKTEEYDYDANDRQWILGRDYLEGQGLFQYEVSNFAKKGFESIHNTSYWKQKDYCGCGSGAVGTFYKKRLRYSGTRDIKTYCSFWLLNDVIDESLIPREVEHLSEKDCESEFLMMGFRMTCGISEDEYRLRFNKSLSDRLNRSSVWRSFLSEKKAFYCGGRYGLTKDGLLFLNVLLRDLFY